MLHTLWTVGHSTRSVEELIRLLQAHGIRWLVDVRALPYSRRNPQFNTDALAKSLQDAGIRYLALPRLGGRRKTRADSINVGWRNAGFRGYADYMQTDEFRAGLQQLMTVAETSWTAIMCAEAVPWRCHRSLIADALVSQGWEVRHILSGTKANPHAFTPFAQVIDGQICYPKTSAADSTSGLF
jgi:uncharacterized protein (DUF488 family)